MTDVDHGDAAPESPKTSSDREPPFRIWIPLLCLALMLVTRYVPSTIEDGPPMIWMLAAFGPLLLSFGLVLWWLFLSRARWSERLVGTVALFAIIAGTLALIDPSMMGPAVMIITIPVGMAAFALTACLTSRMQPPLRTWLAIGAALIGFGFSTLLQADGMWGNFAIEIDWRWKPTAEERFMASRSDASVEDEIAVETDSLNSSLVAPVWPAFRGTNRDGVQRGTQLISEWDDVVLDELWRVPVGPAWSSFVVAGDLLFTQEQRGELETVVCYDATTGKEVWASGVESRFSDPLGGPGPRATPTIDGEYLYAMGAEGILCKLKAVDGQPVWQADLRKLAEREPPMWGYSASPLIVGETVLIFAGGDQDRGILALDTNDGSVVWTAPCGVDSYGSVQQVELAGESRLAILTNTGVQILSSQDGSIELDYEWSHQGYRALQPQMIGNDRFLVPTGMGRGTRLVQVERDNDQLVGREVWTSRQIKPDFNDLVVFENHIYGFDNAIFTCVSLEDGVRAWKKGRYGKGQVLLLADSGVLVVASEKGELVLLRASPDEHEELLRIQAMDAKTWNHPVVAGDRLYLRNAEEAVCYQLPVVPSNTPEQESQ